MHNTNVCSYLQAKKMGYSVECHHNINVVDRRKKNND